MLGIPPESIKGNKVSKKNRFLKLNGNMTVPLRNRMFGFLESKGLSFESTPSNEVLALSCLQHIKIKNDIRSSTGVVELYHALVEFRDHVHTPRKKAKPRPSPKLKKADRWSFYDSDAWKHARYQALKANDGRCELCGSSKHDGIVLHVDHIKPRSLYPSLELVVTNLQVLCEPCNIGKSNRDETDWRSAKPASSTVSHSD